MRARIRVQQLRDAAHCLERAADAAWRMTQFPLSTVNPCQHQWQAAVAEIQAAMALIEAAQEPDRD